MVVELRDRNRILPRLYEDFVTYVEEISLIEEKYLWQNVRIYVNDQNSCQEFLILRLAVSPKRKNISVYMTAESSATVQTFSDVLKEKKKINVHVQTTTREAHIRQFMPWLTKSYTVRYCCATSTSFQPHCQHQEKAIRLTAENIKQFNLSASPLFIKRLKTAPVYGYVNEHKELIATSGVGFLTKKSFGISYTETRPEYRCQGIAKCLTSLASEPLIKKGLIGIYAADITNQPSLRVARGLGFQPYRDLKCFYN